MISDETSLNAALSLADCWALFHYGYSLYFENLAEKTWQVSTASKALSLSTPLSSPQPLNLKKRGVD